MGVVKGQTSTGLRLTLSGALEQAPGRPCQVPACPTHRTPAGIKEFTMCGRGAGTSGLARPPKQLLYACQPGPLHAPSCAPSAALPGLGHAPKGTHLQASRRKRKCQLRRKGRLVHAALARQHEHDVLDRCQPGGDGYQIRVGPLGCRCAGLLVGAARAGGRSAGGVTGGAGAVCTERGGVRSRGWEDLPHEA